MSFLFCMTPVMRSDAEVQSGLGSGFHRLLLPPPQDQRHDVLPEIWSGHNVADFVDPDIDEKLRALERDEDAAAAEAQRLVSRSSAAQHRDSPTNSSEQKQAGPSDSRSTRCPSGFRPILRISRLLVASFWVGCLKPSQLFHSVACHTVPVAELYLSLMTTFTNQPPTLATRLASARYAINPDFNPTRQ